MGHPTMQENDTAKLTPTLMKNKQNGFVPRVLNIRYIKTLNFAKMKS